ncbi:MAG: hypothetical protein HOD92_24050 [Deltaproteobacteria bacterium]|jgi:hypothetical protein|nr:hypothetical protein [Deltaproteobacteria bacterium]
MEETCFVIMPIGTQNFDGVEYTETDLKKKYDDLIKEAISTAKDGMQVYRADDVSMPGSITNDILTRLMFSKYVIADISLPNPNVFYELGIRHAIKTGTILIKDKTIKNSVFDISHLRHIEYENTASGLKSLSEKIKQAFAWINKNPQKADNQFIELAGFVKYRYPQFIDIEEEKRKKQKALMAMITPLMRDPEILKMLMNNDISQEEKNKKMAKLFQNDPEIMTEVIKTLISLK